jgi:hypothetical protein
MLERLAFLAFLAQNPAPAAPAATNAQPSQEQTTSGLKHRDGLTEPGTYQVESGTQILLNVIKSVSTKQALPGDRLYLETAFPVVAKDRIVIPQGSYVTGTLVNVKRPGRAKGRGELQVRFDSIILPNGVSRNFRSDLSGLDASNDGTLKREESKVQGPGDKKGDAGKVIGATETGGVIGAVGGAAAGNTGRGGLIGLAGGATAGLVGVLFTRGPDATLMRGSTVEMVLDRPLTFSDADLDMRNASPHAPLAEGNQAAPQQKSGWPPRSPF